MIKHVKITLDLTKLFSGISTVLICSNTYAFLYFMSYHSSWFQWKTSLDIFGLETCQHLKLWSVVCTLITLAAVNCKYVCIYPIGVLCGLNVWSCYYKIFSFLVQLIHDYLNKRFKLCMSFCWVHIPMVMHIRVCTHNVEKHCLPQHRVIHRCL